MNKYHPIDYIYDVVPVEGKVYNDDGMNEWKGYHLFIIRDLDEYDSIEDWKNDQIEGHPNVHMFTARSFGRGSDDIVDSVLECHPMNDQNDVDYFSSRNLISMEDIPIRNPEMLICAVNMYRGQIGKKKFGTKDKYIKEIEKSTFNDIIISSGW